MAQCSTDFSEYTTDLAPGDWTERHYAGDVTITVRDDGDIGGKCLEICSDNNVCTVSWDDPGTPSDVEVLAKLRHTTTADTSTRYIGAAIKGSGDEAGRSFYHGYINSRTSLKNYCLQRAVSGSFTNLGCKTPPEIAANTWYWLRIRSIGTDLKLKVWEDGEAEPGTWGYEFTDSNLASGWAGLSSFLNGGYADCDYFAVGTEGSSAPSPSGGNVTVELNKLSAGCSVKDLGVSVGELFETDFSEYTLEQAPSDWTEYWEDSATLDIQGDGDLGGKCMEVEVYEGGRVAAVWDDVGTPVNVEVLCKCRLISDGYTSSAGIFIRGSGEIGSGYCYEATLSSSDSLILRKRKGDGADYLITSEPFTVDYDTWYWIRFQVIGNSLKAKAWEDGDAEPGWLIETTDSDVTGSGWVAYKYSSSSLNYSHSDCDYFAAGTRGLSPDEPGHNIELDKLELSGTVKGLSVILGEYIIPLNKLEAGASIKNITAGYPMTTINLDKLSASASVKDLTPMLSLGVMDADLPALECEAHMATNLSMDALFPDLRCDANFGARLNSDAKLPALKFEARMGSRFQDRNFPVLESEASLSENVVFSSDAKFPVLKMSDTRMGSRMDSKLPALEMEGSLVSDILLSMDKLFPGLTCEAFMHCSSLGSIDAKLPALLMDASISQDNVFTIDKMFPGLKCSASMYCSSLGSIDAMLPVLQAEANLYQEGTMSMDAKFPALLMSGEGYGTGDGTGGGHLTEKSRFEDYILRYSRW